MSLTVLIVDDEENTRQNLTIILTAKGYEVIGAATMAEARECIKQDKADIILLDVQLPDGYGPALLSEIAVLPVRPPVIVITGYGDIEMAVEAMRNGAHDFLQKSIQVPELEKSLQRAGETVMMRRELAHMRSAQTAQLDFVVGYSRRMLTLLDQARRAAATSVSVLITGETGTGKEVLARAIHAFGTKGGKGSDRPFIPENCAAIQATVLESELFGYEAGAFTGAEKRKHGLMEIADGGILFLDEISSMPLDIQAKLLRAIEDGTFRRVGGTNQIHVDVQIIAASNRDLPAMMAEGRFREDLYYRLKVVDLHLPPLRERKEDIPELVGLFIRRNNARMGMNVTDVTPKAMDMLLAHRWPGNIRELRNVIERAMLFCDGPSIDVCHLPAEITHM